VTANGSILSVMGRLRNRSGAILATIALHCLV
jgi:hypothetical protein